MLPSNGPHDHDGRNRNELAQRLGAALACALVVLNCWGQRGCLETSTCDNSGQGLGRLFEAKRTEGVNVFACLDEATPRNDPMSLTDITRTAVREYALYALLAPLVALFGLLGAWVVAGFAEG